MLLRDGTRQNRYTLYRITRRDGQPLVCIECACNIRYDSVGVIVGKKLAPHVEKAITLLSWHEKMEYTKIFACIYGKVLPSSSKYYYILAREGVKPSEGWR